jgi:hypothetical protein
MSQGNGLGERIITGLTVRYVLVLAALAGLAVKQWGQDLHYHFFPWTSPAHGR